MSADSSSTIECDECGMCYEHKDELLECPNQGPGECNAMYCHKCALLCSYCEDTVCPLCAQNCSGCSAVHCARERNALLKMLCCGDRLCVDCVEEMTFQCACDGVPHVVCREHAAAGDVALGDKCNIYTLNFH